MAPNDDATGRVILAGSQNYEIWRQDCLMTLRANDVDEYIDGELFADPTTLQGADRTDAVIEWLAGEEEVPENGFSSQKVTANTSKWLKINTRKYLEWKKNNNKALTEIYRSCVDWIKPQINKCETAKEAWEILKKQYGQEGFNGVYRQMKTLRHLTLDNCDSLEDYTNQFRNGISVLDKAGKSLNNDIVSALYLEGLGNRFKLLVRELTIHDECLPFNDITQRVFTEERNMTSKVEKKTENNVKRDNKDNKPTRKRERLHCEYHGDNFTHDSEHCYTLKRQISQVTQSLKTTPEVSASAGTTLGHVAQLSEDIKGFKVSIDDINDTLSNGGYIGMTTLTETTDKDTIDTTERQVSKKSIFLIDSGATHHMTNTMDNFVTFTYHTKTAHVADGRLMESKGYGDVIVDLDLKDGNVLPLRLRDVYYFPDLDVNLVSVAKLQTQGLAVSLQDIRNTPVGLYKGNIPIGYIEKVKDVFVLRTTGTTAKTLPDLQHQALKASVKDSARLWHRRMAHLGIDNLNRLKHVALGIDFKDDFGDNCEDCIMANQSRSARNGTAAGTAKTVGELVHTDLCGPFQVQSLQGNTYWMPIVDDYSRRVVMYYMRSKDEAPKFFQHYLAREKALGHSVTKVRFDNGGEFRSTTLMDFLKSEGLLIEPTPAYSPESNGLAERTNGTIQSKIRAILQESGLPLFLWQAISDMACYLHNRSPSRPLNGITPFEKYHGDKPDLSHLRVPGCKVFVYIPDEKRQSARVPKLTPRSRLGRFVGYTNSKSIYLIYDPAKRRITTERDLTFQEGPAITGDTLSPAKLLTENFDEEVDNLADGDPVPYSSKFREEQVQLPKTNIRIEIPRRSTRGYINATNLDDETFARAFYTAAGTGNKTVSYEQARKSADWPEWQEAMTREYNALVDNGTWQEVKQQPGMKVLPGHWVLVQKPDRKKARYVVQGNLQEKGVDYNETYAGTARSGSIKLLCALMATEDLVTGQLDALNAFLNSTLKGTTIFVKYPPGFGKKGFCCRLIKTLYGLCQSPREWWRDLTAKIQSLGFRQCEADHSVFVNNDGVVIIVYVDDIALFAKSTTAIQTAKDQLMKFYKMRDLGELKTFVGIQIERLQDGIFIHQSEYTKHTLDLYGFGNSTHGVRVPFDPNTILSARKDTCPPEALKTYQEMVGRVNWLSTISRPDIAYAASRLAQFNANPPDEAIAACKHLYRYLRGTADYGIFYSKHEEAELLGYTDSNWGDNNSLDDKKSTTGYCFTFAGAPISWASRKQRTTATSSTEAEYVAQCSATKEAVYLRQFLQELVRPTQGATVINADNMGAIALARNPVNQGRSRHIDFQYHYTREKLQDGTITLNYVPTNQMTADGFTKPLSYTKFAIFRSQLGMREL